ncbi:MAG: tyrosine-protein kinase Etk/Wzc, partial [Dokdonia sp.]
MEQDAREDYDHGESGRVSFDFRGYLFKILNLWKFVLLSIGVALLVAYYINVRKQNVYKLDSLISVENDQNPFFTANTSISFNWGGVSGKVGKIITAIRTRTHNEKVVDSLQFYMDYLVEGKYRKTDIYKKVPFDFVIDKSKPQVLGYPVGIRFLNANEFEVFTAFEGSTRSAQIYANQSVKKVSVPIGVSKNTFKSGEVIDLPFLNGRLVFKRSLMVKPQSEYYIKFSNFDAVVNRYQNAIMIAPAAQAASSVLKLQLAGNNKDKIVD